MQVIAAAPPASRASRAAVLRSAVIAVLLIVAGAMLAYLCVGTPIMGTFVPTGRPSAMQAAVGIVAWGFASGVPAGFLLIGVAKVLGTLESLSAMRPDAVTPRLARALGSDHVAATNLVIPGGRRIHELVLGPFGMVVLGDVPPPGVSRHVGSRWEVKGPRGRWIPIEAPLDRAARDAERVRGWLATDDRDFLVKVYAAIVTVGGGPPRAAWPHARAARAPRGAYPVGRRRPVAAGGGRGARTRTWNRRDISPLL